MTGYASDTILVGNFSLDAEIKSVNSKSFDLKIYLPEYMTFMENDIRQLVSKQIARGSIVLKIKAKQNDEASSNFTLNNEVLNTAIDEIKTKEGEFLLDYSFQVSHERPDWIEAGREIGYLTICPIDELVMSSKVYSLVTNTTDYLLQVGLDQDKTSSYAEQVYYADTDKTFTLSTTQGIAIP